MIRVTLTSESDVAGWRGQARGLLAARVAPDQVEWTVASRADASDLFAGDAPPPPVQPQAEGNVRVARDLVEALDTALLHRDPGRFALSYRCLWRSQQQPGFHRNPADPDAAALQAMARAVRHDIHRMHAFLRFRFAGVAESGRERFVAWFEPAHHVAEAAAPFFRERFAALDWLIVTPEASIAWDGQALKVGPGGRPTDVPAEDAVEEEWRAYYGSIFNPARLKVQAMKSEMPVRYWRNLPEARLIAPLIRGSAARVTAMVAAGQASAPAVSIAPISDPPRAEGFATLSALYDALARANSLPREGFSDRLVVGEGPVPARLMLVGEQPGDQEDLAGRPFVGPAGEMLDRALAEAGIERSTSFVTNAVKRFKFVARGKRRIHAKPANEEIDLYRWWLEEERRIVAPDLVVALGASAARALTGRSLTISRTRGQIMPLRDDCRLLITVHPSFILRIPDESGRRVEYQKLVSDLDLAAAVT